MGLHIVVVGNPVDGLTFYGPFKTEQDAIDAADRHTAEEWWIAPLLELVEHA